MTTLGFGESTRYGAVLYAYVLGVLVVGGASLAVGVALAWPEFRAWRGPGVAQLVPGIAGALLSFLGLSVLFIGGYAVAYKLLADGVAAGRRSSTGEEPAATAVVDDAPDQNGETDRSVEEAPREPSPSEIAWGTTEEPDSGDSATGNEPLPGENVGSDPLGERSE